MRDFSKLTRSHKAREELANSAARRTHRGVPNELLSGREAPATLVRTHANTLQRTLGNRATSDMLGASKTGGGCSCGGTCAKCSAAHAPATRPSVRGESNNIRIIPTPMPATSSLMETSEGTETVLGGTASTTTTSVCSSGISSGSFTSIPGASTIAATLSGNKLGASFTMVGDFVAAQANCSSACGEYRQYVRGQFTKNGTAVVHRLCGNTLDPTTYHEDCATIGGTNYRYGYHSNRFATSYFDNPDQATGLTFHGSDAPGIRGVTGDQLSVQLDFRGELVDACNGNTVLQTAEWSVAGNATVP
jgi:hypothetical protein